eukprot:jgi/Botrbrau1/799/Bobra.0181s0052.1
MGICKTNWSAHSVRFKVGGHSNLFKPALQVSLTCSTSTPATPLGTAAFHNPFSVVKGVVQIFCVNRPHIHVCLRPVMLCWALRCICRC